MNKTQFRAAFRMARLVQGFEKDCLNDSVSSLGFAVPVQAYLAALRWPDALAHAHSRYSPRRNRLSLDFSRPRLPA